ncbi:MAG: FtsX-like permease family protein [Clostridium sp.]|nr:FtsX-like permease family protein [Clostridium sp.]
MWFKKLKKKKLQGFLIGMFIFLSVLIFTTSLSLITSINNYVNKYYSNESLYDMLIFEQNSNAKNDVLNWCKKSNKVANTYSSDTFFSSYNIYSKGKKLDISNYGIYPLSSVNNIPFGITKVKTLNNTSCPNKGEIWVTQLFANDYNLSLGDYLKFKEKGKTVSLKITSLINDSTQPSSTIGNTYLYINENDKSNFLDYPKVHFIFVKPKKGINLKNLETDMKPCIGKTGDIIDKDTFISGSTSTIDMVGGASTLASILILFVSLFLIRFIMWNSILKEYKSIGVYKALGFTNIEITKMYVIGYSIIAFISSTLGALAIIPIINYTASKVLKYIGNFKSVTINYSELALIIVLFTIAVVLNLYLVIRKTYKISPVKALAVGVTSSRKKLTKSLIKDNSSPLALAINDIFKYKKVSLHITLNLALTMALIILFANLNLTISKMEQNTNVWFGTPKANVTITSGESNNENKQQIKEALNYVKNDSRIKNYVYGNMGTPDVSIDTTKYKIKSNYYGIETMNSYRNDMDFTIINGHNPKNDNEIAVSINILKDLGLSVGDYMELIVNNKVKTFLISGSYNLVMEDGYYIRMLNSAVQKDNPKMSYGEIYVNLKNSSDINSFKKDINKKFVNIEANDVDSMIKQVIKSIPGEILPITSLLILVFIIFSIVTVFNIIMMNVRDNRRNFGIMKTLGFTYREIQNRYLYRIMILTVISSFIAVTLNLIFSRKIVALVIENMDVLIVSKEMIISIVLAMFVLIVLVTLLCCRAINKAKPTELMEE